jgi:LysW-gamma-L-lysine carboxypeptidase
LNPSDTFACTLLEQLVRTPSLSGHERPAIELFTRAARELGLESHIDEAGNGIATVPPIPAVLGRNRCRTQTTDPSSAPTIILLGHIDTVPGNIPVRIENNILHGRGTVDAKGPLAAMLVAAARANLLPSTSLHVIAAVGEETPESPGARHIVRTHRADACIIGEPSGASGFALGYKGRLLLTARFELALAHSAGPQGSAADAAIRWWSGVLQLVHNANPAPEGIFDSLQASIRDITTTTDDLTDSATIHAGFRLPTRITPQDLEQQIRNIPDPPTHLTFTGHTPAFRAARNNDVASALAAAIRDEGLTPRPQLKTGTADMNIVGPSGGGGWNCPIAAFGPGDSSLDHTPNEHINLDEFTRSIRILTRAIESLSHRLASAD